MIKAQAEEESDKPQHSCYHPSTLAKQWPESEQVGLCFWPLSPSNIGIVTYSQAVAIQASLSLLVCQQASDRVHKWVLCLDDDVVLPPSALEMLVERMEAEPSCFMATGALFALETCALTHVCILRTHTLKRRDYRAADSLCIIALHCCSHGEAAFCQSQLHVRRFTYRTLISFLFIPSRFLSLLYIPLSSIWL